MKLADWLFANRLTPEQLRRMLGVANRTTIHRYCEGSRTPRADLLQQIHEITQGEVTLADFLDTGPPKCAAIVQSRTGESRLVFPWSKRTPEIDAALEQLNRAPGEHTHLSDPVTRALEVLGPRARFTKRGVFLLDGHVSDARRVVAAANQLLEAEGQPPIDYPGVSRGTQ